MLDNWFFYTDIKVDHIFVSKIREFYNRTDIIWEVCPKNRTAMNDSKGDNECSNMMIVTDEFIKKNSNLYDEFFKFINFENNTKFPMNILITLLKLENGTRFTPHFDNPKCAILYHFKDPDPINFYNEKNEIILSAKYNFALLNGAVKHGVEKLTDDRVWFKVSIANYGYYQLRELLYKNNLIAT